MEGERKEGGEFRREMEKEVMEGGVRREDKKKRKGTEWEHRDFGNVEEEEGLEDVGGKGKRDNVICFQKSKKTSRSPVRKGE